MRLFFLSSLKQTMAYKRPVTHNWDLKFKEIQITMVQRLISLLSKVVYLAYPTSGRTEAKITLLSGKLKKFIHELRNWVAMFDLKKK